ncbi:S1 family peptidase [Roseobacter sinensis]|uniref:S1 family peptidase n=1 Tax=Roseobacter sinensis TaxID=2931391 RepID=A0ABT3BGH9_9RHOB|nr:S1 family peptidase [Roseobacter sp. WL0113]MCV3272689.1 S1 family peptidase [Roseobacter sp. WL0113]
MNTSDLSPEDIPEEDRRAALMMRNHLPQFIASNPFTRYGAFGVGIGLPTRGGKYEPRLTLRIYVACKIKTDQLPHERRIPKTVQIPDGQGGKIDFPTDVVVAAPPQALMEDPEDRLRPVPGGTSISVPGSGFNGTLGAWVLDTTDDTVVALSNRHVLGGTLGAAVVQPGTQDGGNPAEDRIGFVKRVVPINPAPPNPTPADCDYVDAGIVGADDPDLILLTVLGLGPAIYDTGNAGWLTPVWKSGQTTGVTSGRVIDTDAAFSFPLLLSPGGNTTTILICDNYYFEPAPGTPLPGVVSSGDSGSVLFIEEEDVTLPRATGLVWAQADNWGIACKINRVFEALDLDVLCSSGYPSYLDGLANDVSEPAGPRFTLSERARASAGMVTSGLARSVDKRLRGSTAGAKLSDLVRDFRHPILQGLIGQCDLRRAATRALLPLLGGARTSDDVFGHVMTDEDTTNIARLLDVLDREGHGDLARRLSTIPIAGKEAIGKSVGTLLGIECNAH